MSRQPSKSDQFLAALEAYERENGKDPIQIIMNALTYIDLVRELDIKNRFASVTLILHKNSGYVRLDNTMDRNKFILK